ncbi:MAG: type I methionyl aminopeptidase [Victivallaceae bacterium]
MIFRKRNFIIHTPEEIVRIRRATEATAFVRDQIPQMVTAGMTTGDINELAGRLIKETGGTSAFLGYYGFPGNICISVNDEVIHGIGSHQRVLAETDIVSIDVGVCIDNACGDSALTFSLCEKPSEEVKMLLNNTRQALMNGIKAAVSGKHISDISRAIENTARAAKLGVVRDYVGHGCGVKLHEPPEIPNFVMPGECGPKLVPGMVLAIEPMFNLGTYRVKTDGDNWTVRTCDGKWSAHFEHMILITDNKPEILTWQKTM